MNRYKIEHNGQIYTVEAATQDEALSLVTKQGDAPKPAAQTRADQVNAEYNAKPWYAKAGQAADDIVRLAANGITFGFADKLAGAASGDVKAERQRSEDARSRAGLAGTVAEIGGGVGTGVGAARAGLTAARFVPGNLEGARRLLGLSAAGAVDGAAMGALSGAGNTDDGNYLENMGKGAAIGGVVGGAAPAVVAGAAKVAEPVTNAILSRVAPEAFSRRLAMKAVENSGKSVDDIRASMQQAAADGQGGVYTVADAMGVGGARSLNSVARGNSPEAMRIKELLDARQAGQGERIEGAIREGLGANQTAEQLARKLEGIRKQAGNADYPEAAKLAAPVNTSRAIQEIDRGISPSGVASTLDDNPIQAALRGTRARLTNDKETLTDFEGVRQLFRSTRDDATAAYRAGKGGEGEALSGVSKNLREALEEAYPPFAAMQRKQANLFKAEEAIDKGKALGQRGLYQDTQEAMARMSPQEAGAARVGYADSLIARAQKLGEGANKGRALTADKYANELSVVAKPGRYEELQRRLAREGDMFATRSTVTGGSQTANNLADLAAAGGGGYASYDFMHGGLSPSGSVAALLAARRGLTRLPPTEAARRELAKALLSSNADDIGAMAAKTAKGREISEASIAAMARALALGGIGATSSPR